MMSDEKFGFNLSCGGCIGAVIVVHLLLIVVNPPQMAEYFLYNMVFILCIPITIYILASIWWRKTNPPPRRTRIVTTVDQSRAIRSKTKKRKKESRDIDDVQYIPSPKISSHHASGSKKKSASRVQSTPKKIPSPARVKSSSGSKQKTREEKPTVEKALNNNIFAGYLKRMKDDGYQFLTLTKMKNDLHVSKGKVKKLYTILDHFCEKKHISRLKGSRFALHG